MLGEVGRVEGGEAVEEVELGEGGCYDWRKGQCGGGSGGVFLCWEGGLWKRVGSARGRW